MTNAERRWEEATLNRLTDNLTKVFRLVIGTLYNNLKQKISLQELATTLVWQAGT